METLLFLQAAGLIAWSLVAAEQVVVLEIPQ
jgi:hypothetical protein